MQILQAGIPPEKFEHYLGLCEVCGCLFACEADEVDDGIAECPTEGCDNMVCCAPRRQDLTL
jgi:hypothetical protein